MSIGATIRRGDRKPLGALSEVQAKLQTVFPGTKFVAIEDPPDLAAVAKNAKHRSVGIQRPKPTQAVAWAILKRFQPSLRFPYVEGLFEGDGFAATFELRPDPEVQDLTVTLYGARTTNADTYLEELTLSNGWELYWH